MDCCRQGAPASHGGLAYVHQRGEIRLVGSVSQSRGATATLGLRDPYSVVRPLQAGALADSSPYLPGTLDDDATQQLLNP